ncbi:MAG: potassium channel family protein [Gemmatimonadaceae bacterium]
MKFLPAQLAFFLQSQRARSNVGALLKLMGIMVVMVVAYSVAFHLLMAREGRDHSWITGLYWTLTVMSTLGFGDITFTSDAGRIFSVVVLISGVIFLLVLLPFTFIQFFYAPWMEAQRQRRAPRELPNDTRDHVILTQYDPLAMSLIERLELYGRPYVVLEPELNRALELHELGVRVMLGDLDDEESYRRMRTHQAALVVAGVDDFVNTNITFLARGLSERTPIVALARDHDSVAILELAGATQVLQLADMLGRSLARRALGGETRANVIGRFASLIIAEAPVMGTPLVGRRLMDSGLREATGLTVVGVWERGRFTPASPQSRIESTSVLLLAGTEDQLQAFDELVVIYNAPDDPVLILGGGRVGRAAAASLAERGVPYRIVEKNPAMVRDPEHYVEGSAADLAVLKRAGIDAAPTTIVTTNHDATNVYLTIFCRRLRPTMQIIARSNLERNITTLHRAGADLVMSYPSMGADAIFNVLEKNDLFMVAEGLDVFRYPAPPTLAGRTLAESRIREETGCLVLAIEIDGELVPSPPPSTRIPARAELILIGTTAAGQRFKEEFVRPS